VGPGPERKKEEEKSEKEIKVNNNGGGGSGGVAGWGIQAGQILGWRAGGVLGISGVVAVA
jgi:hypothetical protein